MNGACHQLLLHTLNTLAMLTLEQGSPSDVMEVLFMLDQILKSAEKQLCGGELQVVTLREIRAQFFHHAACLLIRRAQQVPRDWKSTQPSL